MKYQLAPVSYQQPCQQQQYQQLQQQHYLTIEDIKSTRNSCWLCGCNWLEDHVSLDCPECGGYALTRPCPNCDGKCQQQWTRNISATHDRHKALWSGQCKFQQQSNNNTTPAIKLSGAERFKAAAQAAAAMITASKNGCINHNMFSSSYQATKVKAATATTTTTPPPTQPHAATTTILPRPIQGGLEQ